MFTAHTHTHTHTHARIILLRWSVLQSEKLLLACLEVNRKLIFEGKKKLTVAGEMPEE